MCKYNVCNIAMNIIWQKKVKNHYNMKKILVLICIYRKVCVHVYIHTYFNCLDILIFCLHLNLMQCKVFFWMSK